MLCFVALFVFLFLSLFSAKYRSLAKRAFDCVLRKTTLRPCESNLEDELKAASIASIMRISPKLASFINRHFEVFSFAFAILFFLSLFLAMQGLYNFILYGNCNGPEERGFCVYSGLQNELFLKAPSSLSGISVGNPASKVVVVEFGCYTCPYTKMAEPSVLRLLSIYKDRIYFVYKAFPLPSHPYSREAALAAFCANDEGKYWEYRSEIFSRQADIIKAGEPVLFEIAQKLNLSSFEKCYKDRKYESQINSNIEECTSSGIYGTPTFFVNGKPFVGPKATDSVEKEIKRLLGEE